MAAESFSQSQIGCKCQIYESDKVNARQLPTLVSYLNMIKDKCKFQLRVHSCKTDTGRKNAGRWEITIRCPPSDQKGLTECHDFDFDDDERETQRHKLERHTAE